MFKKYFFFIPVFAAGVVLGAFLSISYAKVQCENYVYINHDIACGEKPVISKVGYAKLENDLHTLIGERQQSGEVSEVSIYFRDLHGGPAFGINEEETFAPASLLKLPLVITYLALEEETPGFLSTKVTYDESLLESYMIPIQPENASIELRPGQIYTLDDLIQNTIIYSDNLSYYLLLAFLTQRVEQGGDDMLLRTFQELGIIDPRNIAEEVITVRNYSSIFRILYNTSYLNNELSEKALSLLVQSIFNKGLMGGVPEGTKVANKFGERQLPDGTEQLHDYGIIYYPGNPYLLCVMTKGHEQEVLAKLIRDISERVYEEVNSRRL